MEDERQLIKQAKNGDVEAFMVLVKRYEKPIYHLVYRLTRNQEDAADLTQETMLKAFKGLKTFKEKSSFHTWLHRIAVNLSLNFLEKNRARKDQLEYLDQRLNEETELRAETGNENWSPAEELRENLEKALAELPLIYKTAFFLVVFQGLSHREAAEVLGCSEGTVSWRIHEARKMLRERLKPFINQSRRS